jgi:hypothetical protein
MKRDFRETRLYAGNLNLTFLHLAVSISFAVWASSSWGQGSTTNGNGSVGDQISADVWVSGYGTNVAGDSVSVSGPWDLGGPSENAGGAGAAVGHVDLGVAASPVPTPTPTDTVTPEPSPTPTDTPTDGPSPTPTDTPTDGPSSTPTPTATCDVTDSDFDLIADGVVNAEDLLGFLTELESGTFSSDFNCDGTSDSLDLFLMAEKWGIAFAP